MSRSEPHGERFFLAHTLVQLGLVFAGFAPTFYLRSAEHAPLSALLVAHGAFLTAWYLLAVVQSALIGAAKSATGLELHKRLGALSGVILVGTVWTGCSVAIHFYRAGADDQVLSPAALLLFNLSGLTLFALCCTAGVALRRRAAAHKRFLVLAGVMILNPASFRIAHQLGIDESLSGVLSLVLILALMVYDLRSAKRVHWVSGVGLVLFLAQLASAVALDESEALARLAEAWFGVG